MVVGVDMEMEIEELVYIKVGIAAEGSGEVLMVVLVVLVG